MKKYTIETNNLYYNFTKIDSYNKPFNFTISGRGSGKTTSAIFTKILKSAKMGYPYLVIRRRKVELNAGYIQSFEDKINEFSDKKVVLTYSKGDLSSGIVDVYLNDIILARFLALSCNLSDIKSHLLENIGGILYDEFICNMKKGEKYLKDEWLTFREVYTTYNRNSAGVLKCYFLGNPYSLYNPYFLGLKVDIDKVKRGSILSPKNKPYAIDYYVLKPELVKKILAKNPLFFDEEYYNYGIEGQAVDDKDILIIKKQPQSFKLSRVFFVNNKNIGVYVSNKRMADIYYWVDFVDSKKINRNIYCLSIENLANRRIVLSYEDIKNNMQLATAMRLRKVAFSDVNAYYLFVEVYKML